MRPEPRATNEQAWEETPCRVSLWSSNATMRVQTSLAFRDTLNVRLAFEPTREGISDITIIDLDGSTGWRTSIPDCALGMTLRTDSVWIEHCLSENLMGLLAGPQRVRAPAIRDAIQRLRQGQYAFDDAILCVLLERVRRVGPPSGAGAPPVPQLTRRETEVLGYLVRGASNHSIAKACGITYHTAASHVRHILAKLEARNRSEAAFKALHWRLLPLPSRPERRLD